MQTQNFDVLGFVLKILTFPLLIQGPFLAFAWGATDPNWMLIAKRMFLLLPVLVFILGCWVSIASLVTVVIRQNRKEFVTALFITWWDLGKAVVSFWGGFFILVFHVFMTVVELVKILIVGIWTVVQEVLFMPFRVMGNIGSGLMTTNIPWLAIFLTMLWCLLETVIFTYVTSPLVMDTFANITGETISETFIRIPLFIFLFFIVLGSYAVLASFMDAVRSKDIGAIVGIGCIEVIVMMVEVVFLYREFVDSLIPWMAQHSENFELGIGGTLGIAAFAWFGIRSLSWFLFASHGTPTILTIIKGKGVHLQKNDTTAAAKPVRSTSNLLDHIKNDMAWFQQKGEELLASFMLPPLQVVAVGINFCTLLLIGRHLFRIPFKTIQDITDSTTLLKSLGHPNIEQTRENARAHDSRHSGGLGVINPKAAK
ncbi:MAG: hypothetical protein DWQ05_01625 [Calditrichaeota bacterium]|nr:MAG: hypothetical protein DWQ05_01625 [Calditrichota bacterium]